MDKYITSLKRTKYFKECVMTTPVRDLAATSLPSKLNPCKFRAVYFLHGLFRSRGAYTLVGSPSFFSPSFRGFLQPRRERERIIAAAIFYEANRQCIHRYARAAEESMRVEASVSDIVSLLSFFLSPTPNG